MNKLFIPIGLLAVGLVIIAFIIVLNPLATENEILFAHIITAISCVGGLWVIHSYKTNVFSPTIDTIYKTGMAIAIAILLFKIVNLLIS